MRLKFRIYVIIVLVKFGMYVIIVFVSRFYYFTNFDIICNINLRIETVYVKMEIINNTVSSEQCKIKYRIQRLGTAVGCF